MAAPSARTSSPCASVRGITTAWASPPPRGAASLAVEVVAGVVLGGLRRRPDDDQDLLPVEPELVEHGRIGLEAGQVVLLLQARVADQLLSLAPIRSSRSSGIESGTSTRRATRKRSGAAGRRTRSPASAPRGCGRAWRRRRGRPSRGRSPGRAVAPGEPRQARRASAERRPLAKPRTAAVAADRRIRDPQPLQDPQRLPVLARGDEDLVPARLKRSMIGRSTKGCAAAVQSTQTRKRRSVTVRATIATAGITCRGCAQPRSPPSPRPASASRPSPPPSTRRPRIRAARPRQGTPLPQPEDRQAGRALPPAQRRRTLLRATSDVKSRGRGPMELHGARNGQRSMRVTSGSTAAAVAGSSSAPARRCASPTSAPTSAAPTGRSTSLPASSCAGSAARRRLGAGGPRRPEAQLLPARPRADPAGPPLARRAHYPGCDQNPYADAVTLGTSVGWSDIYPADYDKQWIESAACAAASPSS